MSIRTLDIRQFTIHRNSTKNDPYLFYPTENMDFYEELKQHLSSFINTIDQKWNIYKPTELYTNEESEDKRTIAIAKIRNSANEEVEQIYYNDQLRYISGKISTGLYGKGGFIIDENKKILFHKEVNHALPRPFYFMICVPAHSDTGYIITEKDGIYGFAGGMCVILRTFVRQHSRSRSLTCQPFIEGELVKKYLTKGVLGEITITTSKLPKNLEDSYGLSSEKGEEYTVELKITPKSKKTSIAGKLIKNILTQHETHTPSIDYKEEFKAIGFDEKSTVSIKSLYQGHQRTIQLNNTNPIRPLYRIKVKIDNDGHSNFESIEEETIKLLESLQLKLFSNGN